MTVATLATLGLAALGLAGSACASQIPNWRQFPIEAISKPPEAPSVDLEPLRVNVTLYAMSRCPDARMCENVFEEVLKHEGIRNKVDLSIDYLGTINKKAAYGVDCMHGDIECAGNAHQLCLAEHLDLKQFYASLSCMNFGTFPGSIGSVALTRKCAETNGVDWWGSGVGRCIQGQRAEREGRAARRQASKQGSGHEVYPAEFDVEDDDAPLEHLAHEARRLLRQSVRRTHKAEVTKSCTIDIISTIKHDGRRRCIVDGGVWKGCDDGHAPADFIRVIEKEWKALNDPEIDLVDANANKEAAESEGADEDDTRYVKHEKIEYDVLEVIEDHSEQ